MEVLLQVVTGFVAGTWFGVWLASKDFFKDIAYFNKPSYEKDKEKFKK